MGLEVVATRITLWATAQVRVRAGTRLGDGRNSLNAHAKSGRGELGRGERSRDDAGGGRRVVGDDDEVENDRAGCGSDGDRIAGDLVGVGVGVGARVSVSVRARVRVRVWVSVNRASLGLGF